MPTMVAPRVQQSLIDGASHKVFVHERLQLHLSSSQHVVEGIVIILEPEFVLCLHVGCRVCSNFRRRVMHRVRVRTMDNRVFSLVHWPVFWLDGPDEPVIPALEPPVRLASVNIVLVPVHIFLGSRAEPAIGILLRQVF